VRQLLHRRGIRGIGLIAGRPAHGDQAEVGAKPQQRVGQRDTSEAGHVDIRDDEGEFFGMSFKQGNCLHAIAAAHDAITMVPESLRDDVAEGYIVVHHEDEFAVTVGNMKRRCADWLG